MSRNPILLLHKTFIAHYAKDIRMNKIIKVFLLIIAFVIPAQTWSCTIFCAKDEHGHVWVGNNEDFDFFDFNTHITISSGSDSTQSFFYFHYNNPFPQGGVNESGLFYDGNAVETSEIKDADKKEPFPGEIHEILIHILGRCKSVPEVIELFDKYKVPWMQNAQLHFADKLGNKGIITADSTWLTTGSFQVSTNYNLAHDDDDYKRCWRYPIANSMLKDSNPGFELFTNICDSTSQRKGASTIYSNVHNLTTGELWLYYGWDYENPYKTSFNEMIALGDTTFLIREWFKNQHAVKAYNSINEESFSTGLEILNTITDSLQREEKMKILALGALFRLDEYTGRTLFTENNELVQDFIQASSNTEVLSLIAHQKISTTNRRLVEKKLGMIKKSGWDDVLWYGIIIGGIIMILLIVAWKRLSRSQFTNAKN